MNLFLSWPPPPPPPHSYLNMYLDYFVNHCVIAPTHSSYDFINISSCAHLMLHRQIASCGSVK